MIKIIPHKSIKNNIKLQKAAKTNETLKYKTNEF